GGGMPGMPPGMSGYPGMMPGAPAPPPGTFSGAGIPGMGRPGMMGGGMSGYPGMMGGRMPGGMSGYPGMSGAPGAAGASGGLGANLPGQGGTTFADAGGFMWVYFYPKQELVYWFAFNKDGRVIIIVEKGRDQGKPTSRGVKLGDPVRAVYSAYGW